MRLVLLIFGVFLAAVLASCGSGGEESTDPGASGGGNSAPLANAGPDQNIATGSLVTLDGTGSSDADGDPLTCIWIITSKPAGSTAVLSNPAIVNPAFTADLDGTYTVRLVVNDGTVNSAADTVTITAATGNSAPVANAGADRRVATGSFVALDGSGSTDADSDPLTYSWSFASKPGGSTAFLTNPAAVSTSFTADADGTYIVSLVVNDGTVNSAPDTVTITATSTNSAPVADAGNSLSILVGTTVSLDGSASSDADFDPLTYSWAFVTKPGGSGTTLSSSTVVRPAITADTVGIYVISLIVNDGIANSTADTVTITATSTIALAKTGQTNCYDEAGATIACAGTGEDGALLNGVGLPGGPRFTDNLDGTVRDNLTGLVWLKDTNCILSQYPGYDTSGAAGDGRVTLQEALDFVAGIDAGTYPSCGAGYTDWRLPNRNELMSLTDYSQAFVVLTDTILPSGHPFINAVDCAYWTSSTSVVGSLGFSINVGYNSISACAGGAGFYAWPVRSGPNGSISGIYPANTPKTGHSDCYDAGGTAIACAGTGQDGEMQWGVSWPARRFTVHGDGTVTDNLTGLMWLEDANCISTQYPGFDLDSTAGDGHVTWQHALDFVAGVDAGTYPNCGAGYTDWRLPNINELKSLQNSGNSFRVDLWLIAQGFDNVTSINYWSSTTEKTLLGTSGAWATDFAFTFVQGIYKTRAFGVWPVRGGN